MHCQARTGAVEVLGIWHEAEAQEVFVEVGEEQIEIRDEMVRVWGDEVPPASEQSS